MTSNLYAQTPTTARSLPSDEEYRVDRPEIQDLNRRLSSESAVGIGGAVGVGGVGGVGKSSMAIHYAREHYAGRTLYVPMDSGDIRTHQVDLGRALGLEFAPEQSEGQISLLIKDALSSFQGLLILDNAEVEGDVRLLLPAPAGQCKTIITSRDQSLLRAVSGSPPIVLDAFSPHQALQCFRIHLGLERSEKEKEQIDQLCDLLGYLPIAVDVAAATLAAENLPVAAWLQAYPNESQQLEALAPAVTDGRLRTTEEARRSRDVRAVLRLSLRNLPEPERSLARPLLYALACFDQAAGASEAMVTQVSGLEGITDAQVQIELNRLHRRSVLQTPVPGLVGGPRHTMHRLMREVVRQEAGENLASYQARFFRLLAAYPELLSRLVSEGHSDDALLAFQQETADLLSVARAMVGDGPSLLRSTEGLPQQRAEFAANTAQFAIFQWPLALLKRVLTAGLEDARIGGWEWLEANTLKALGDLDLREASLTEARDHYQQALPIYRQIHDSLGEANTLRALAQLNSQEGDQEGAVRGFQQAIALHQRIGDRLGLRGDWGYLGQHYLRHDQPGEAVKALDSSINALPREGDPLGYGLALQLELEAFTQIQVIQGMLACLRLLADADSGLKESYANLLNATKLQAPGADFSDLESALATHPESVRRAAVQSIVEKGSEEAN